MNLLRTSVSSSRLLRLIISLALAAIFAIAPVSPSLAGDPVTSPGWTLSRIFPDAPTGFDNVSCPTSSQCIASGSAVLAPASVNGAEPAIWGTGSVATTSDSGSAWRLTPLPRGLTATITCPTAERCLGFGEAAATDAFGWRTPLYSRNGGKTWHVGNALSGIYVVPVVQCPTKEICFAGASSKTGTKLLTSRDGGESWSVTSAPHLPIAYLDPTSFVCLSATTCIASIDYSDPARSAVTHNAGKSWTLVNMPKSVESVNDMACASVERCVALGWSKEGTPLIIAHTSNGGLSWQTQDITGVDALSKVVCTSDTRCLAIGQEGSYEGTGRVVILASRDGGITWGKPIMVPAMVTDGEDLYCGGTDCFAWGQQYAWGPDVLYESRDFGQTWSQVTLPKYMRTVSEIQCVSDSLCIVAGGDGLGMGVLETLRQGTWHAESFLIAGEQFSISCPSAGHCISIGLSDGSAATPSRTAVVSTRDAGRSWRITVLPTSWSEGTLSCPSASVCEAGGGYPRTGAVLLRSTDGGTSWLWQTVPAGVATIQGMSCPNETHCEATGLSAKGRSMVIATTNGKTWREVPIPKGVSRYTLEGPECPSTRSCFAIGRIYLETDSTAIASMRSGATWRVHRTLRGIHLAGLSCPTEDVCVGVGSGVVDDTWAVSTTNGGKTWTWHRIAAIGDKQPHVTAVSCPNIHDCKAIGPSQFWTSSNGGLTWKEDHEDLPSRSKYWALDLSCATPTWCGASGVDSIFGTGGVFLTYR